MGIETPVYINPLFRLARSQYNRLLREGKVPVWPALSNRWRVHVGADKLTFAPAATAFRITALHCARLCVIEAVDVICPTACRSSVSNEKMLTIRECSQQAPLSLRSLASKGSVGPFVRFSRKIEVTNEIHR